MNLHVILSVIFNDGKYTAKLVDQYRPIVKKSIASVINDIISDRLNVAMKNENKEEKQIPQEVENENQQPNEMNEEKLPDGVVFQRPRKRYSYYTRGVRCL